MIKDNQYMFKIKKISPGNNNKKKTITITIQGKKEHLLELEIVRRAARRSRPRSEATPELQKGRKGGNISGHNNGNDVAINRAELKGS
jgi:hypothetical protein